MKLLPAALLLSGMCCCLPNPARSAVLLYNQPAQTPGTGYGNLSQFDTSPGGYGDYARAYENFTLPATASITEVRWRGQYDDVVPPTPISQFLLSLYADAGGTPGALVSSAVLPGDANQTLVSGSVYDYSATLPGAGFGVVAGTEYWLGIQAFSTEPPGWGWFTGTGGDGNFQQYFLGSWSTEPYDLALSLYGNPVGVPEPGQVASGLVLLAGVAGCVIRRRRATV